ncbi:MAG: metal-sulfur cluster assembly factor [Verrucomicrobia bacterium]|nr:metal-sulfur cluster assembly factor [Verrucomicrobiota bacterium]
METKENLNLENENQPDVARESRGTIKRRTFLGLSLSGFAGLSLPALSQPRAQAAAEGPPTNAIQKSPGVKSAYWERTDRFEEKLKLLEAAWQKKDFRLARALAHSLRSTAIQAQAEEENPGTPLMAASRYEMVESLPSPWNNWAHGWKYCKLLTLAEPIGQQRSAEPVEVLLGFPAEQVTFLARELRVARVADGALKEIPCQVYGEVRRGNERFCKLLFMADCPANQAQTWLVFYGNPDAEFPGYPSDLVTTGEGFGLDIENEFFKASLSRQMGQLERLTLKREHGLELFSGGEGHGEPPGIDWAHDYVDSGSFQKLRITLWDTCSDYEVVRGPLCTMVRRWGFPYSPVHPLFSPSRLNIDVEYRFYAGLPWFHKIGRMEAVKSFEAEGLRDDEWVFSGNSFTDIVWMGPDGKLRIGEVDKEHQENLWGVGFFNKESKDSFIALFLEHKAEGLPELKHSGAPTLSYRWHGQLWSRYPLPGRHVPAGAVLHEKNAYVALPFTTADGPRMIEELRRRLMNPLVASAGEVPKGVTAKASPGRLARPGEAGDSPIPKKVLWDALRDCKDAQLYTADINVVDLGLVYDVRVRGDVVTVIMTMPHRGRPRVGYFAHGSISVHPTYSRPVEERLLQVPGVRQVVVEQTWEPVWSSNQLTDEGRRKLGLS